MFGDAFHIPVQKYYTTYRTNNNNQVTRETHVFFPICGIYVHLNISYSLRLRGLELRERQEQQELRGRQEQLQQQPQPQREVIAARRRRPSPSRSAFAGVHFEFHGATWLENIIASVAKALGGSLLKPTISVLFSFQLPESYPLQGLLVCRSHYS